MTKGCEKPALDIMFPGMSPKICIKADIGDLAYRGSPLFVVDLEPFCCINWKHQYIENCINKMLYRSCP